MKNKKIIGGILLIVLLAAGSFAAKYILSEKESNLTSKSNITSREKGESEDIVFTGERTLYDLNLEFNSDEKKIKGHQTVKFKNKYNSSLKDLVFHLYADSYNSGETKPSIGGTAQKLNKDEIGDIKIDSLKVNNNDSKYTEDKQILKISLDKELKPGEAIEVAMNFTLKIPRGNDRLGYIQDQYSLTNWYPILSIYDEKTASWDENPFYPVGESNYSDCSDYKASITVPKDTVVATTGVKTSQTTENSLDKMNFEAINNRDFVLFLSKDYKVLSKEIEGIKVNSYYLKEQDTAKRMLELACESIKFFNTTFGNYPYPEYDVVETSLQGGAMEYPTVTQMGPYSKLSSEYKENNLTFFDEAVVHETAHQWWYSTVGNNEFKEPILDESFTAYSTALFFEKLYGEYSLNAIKGSFLRFPIKTIAPVYRATDKFTWNDFGVVVYRLGPVILEDLRQKVGEEKFIDIFRTYYQKYKFKNASFEGFLEVVKEKCGSETSEYVRNAFTSKDYSMDKMVLSEAERKKIDEKRGK